MQAPETLENTARIITIKIEKLDDQQKFLLLTSLYQAINAHINEIINSKKVGLILKQGLASEITRVLDTHFLSPDGSAIFSEITRDSQRNDLIQLWSFIKALTENNLPARGSSK